MKRSTQKPSSKRERRAIASFLFGLRLRVATSLIIIGVLFGFGLRVSHMLLVQHVVCAHGHLVDEPKTTSTHPKVRDVDSSDHAEDYDAENVDEHEHCDVMSVHHRGDGFSIIPWATTLCWIEPVGINAARQTNPIEVLVLAPKNSPPAV
ncbi:MAG TPA: hypothetical protein PK156_11085 [Polyangium sp.]|nr:hypothetical protein [Polyangium sp.]